MLTASSSSKQWDNHKQLYLGGFNSERKAATAFDIMAIKCRGPSATTNFDRSIYVNELERIEKTSKEQLILSLRRFSKGKESDAAQTMAASLDHAVIEAMIDNAMLNQ